MIVIRSDEEYFTLVYYDNLYTPKRRTKNKSVEFAQWLREKPEELVTPVSNGIVD